MCAAALATMTAAPARAHDPAGPLGRWAVKDTGHPEVRFRGLAAVDRGTAWLAGSAGTVLRTTDGGANWRDVSPAGAGELQFRDIEAFDARRAVALAIGEGEASRLYRTEDGGATWTETFRNPDPRAFYDCVAFFDRRHGLAMSDPVDGRFRILSTADGGRSWRREPQPDNAPTWLRAISVVPGTHGVIVGAEGAHLRISDGRVLAANGGERAAETLH